MTAEVADWLVLREGLLCEVVGFGGLAVKGRVLPLPSVFDLPRPGEFLLPGKNEIAVFTRGLARSEWAGRIVIASGEVSTLPG
jgi:hypothetical protein